MQGALWQQYSRTVKRGLPLQRQPECLPLGVLQRSLTAVCLCYVLRGPVLSAKVGIADFVYQQVCECANLLVAASALESASCTDPEW